MFNVRSISSGCPNTGTRPDLRSLEVERLDNLQLAVWQMAMDGDVPSAIAVVRCVAVIGTVRPVAPTLWGQGKILLIITKGKRHE